MDIDVYLKRFGWVLNLVLIAILSYMLAKATSNLIAGQYVPVEIGANGNEPVVGGNINPGPGGRPEPSSKDMIRMMEQVIVGRNLFKAKLEDEAAVNNDEVQEEAPEVQEIDAKLLGVIAGRGSKKMATIEAGEPKKVGVYREGDSIDDTSAEVEVIEIVKEFGNIIPKVILAFPSGARQELTMDFSSKVAATGPDTKRPGVADLPGLADRGGFDRNPGIKAISATEYQIDQGEFNSAMENVNDIITQARLVPNFTKDRQVNGFRIFQIKPRSIFQKLGLRNGDVLQRINSIELNDPQKGLEVFQNLRNQSSFTIDLERRNKKMTFSYDVK